VKAKGATIMKTLLHIPHSSYTIPFEYQNLFYLNPLELRKEQIKMTDTYTDDLFDISNIEKLVFPISRLVCDVERFRCEKDEIMSKQGMWVTYTKTSGLSPLKIVSKSHKKEILQKYYDIHHKKFYEKVTNILNQYNECLIIDCHSFSSIPLPYELNQDKRRPDICIGADDFHTPRKLTECIFKLFNSKGYKVEINKPFAGTIVPIEYYGNNSKIQSIMIELNRSLYMDEITSVKSVKYKQLKQDINDIINFLSKMPCSDR
jgi:N-formylglutamate amidohydrolase